MTLPWFSKALGQFQARFEQGRLHHALLFAGKKGIGKQDLAEQLSALILCKHPSSTGRCHACQSCHLFEVGNHPDFHVLMSEKQLGVDAIREAMSKLSATAQISRNKVLLIIGSETMTEAASNALLKTLEEPTANTYIILLTEQLQRLLPTILSRCEKHTLSAPQQQQCVAWLKEQGVDIDVQTLNAYGGAPFEVMAAMEQSDGLLFDEFNQGLAELKRGETNSLALAQKWQNHAELVIKWCLQLAFDAYRSQQNELDYSRYTQFQGALTQARRAGVNKVLILEGVLSAINAH